MGLFDDNVDDFLRYNNDFRNLLALVNVFLPAERPCDLTHERGCIVGLATGNDNLFSRRDRAELDGDDDLQTPVFKDSVQCLPPEWI